MKRNLPAPLWKRVFAYIIDLLIISIVTSLPLRSVYAQSEISSFKDFALIIQQEPTGKLILIQLTIGILGILYWAILEYKLSQSLGKMIMKIKVTSTKGKLTFKKCLLRNLTKIDESIVFLDTLYVLKSGSKRFMDKVSKTEVVEVK